MEIQEIKIGKKQAFIFDGVLDYDEIKRIYANSLKVPYTFTQKSDEENQVFNNRFSYHLETIDFDGPFRALKKAQKKILKRVDLYDKLITADIYINISDAMTPTLMHTDRPNGCWTLLYYANYDWQLNWGGATIFYDPKSLEIATAVRPRPGRFALFQADIPHQATPPTFYCPYKRITIPFKMDPRNHNEIKKETNESENPFRESNSCWIS